jgi:hypothetical protein
VTDLPASKLKTYTCDNCHGMFVSEWTEEEARAEAARDYGPFLGDDPAEICDLCYQELQAWLAEDPTRAQEAERG